MPVTATAKRALRVSTRKALVNTIIISKLEAAIRQAKRNKTAVAVQKATSLADRAAKSKEIHKKKLQRKLQKNKFYNSVFICYIYFKRLLCLGLYGCPKETQESN